MRDLRLDCLRAVAVVLVLGAHWDSLSLWHRAGWMGVDLFFVLSGYLISGLLFREYRNYGAIHVGNFYLRRGLKIYPAFYAMLALTFGLWLRHGSHPPLTNVLAEIFFFQNYHRGLWAHTWSLAVEEHFYFLAPLVLLLMARSGKHDRPFRWIPHLFAGVAIACLVLRIVQARHAPDHTFLFESHLRADALLGGVFLRYLREFRPAALARFEKLPLWLLGAALLAPVVLTDPASWFVRTIGLTLNWLGFGCVLIAALRTHIPERGVLRNVTTAIAAVGFYSYSIYLWHVMIATLLPNLFKRIGLPAVAGLRSLIYVAAAIAVGAGMAKIVEVPALAARDRWFPSRSAALEKRVAAAS